MVQIYPRHAIITLFPSSRRISIDHLLYYACWGLLCRCRLFCCIVPSHNCSACVPLYIPSGIIGEPLRLSRLATVLTPEPLALSKTRIVGSNPTRVRESILVSSVFCVALMLPCNRAHYPSKEPYRLSVISVVAD
jgi:hypothetical protein